MKPDKSSDAHLPGQGMIPLNVDPQIPLMLFSGSAGPSDRETRDKAPACNGQNT